MKKLFVTASLIVCISVYSQQEMQSYLSVYNTLLYNAAYSGINDDASMSLHFDKQWINMDGSPITFQFAGSSLLKYNLSTGAVFQYEEVGITQHTVVDLLLAYKITLSKNTILSMGIGGGFCFLDKDFEELNDDLKTDKYYANQPEKERLPHGQVGLLLHSDKYHFSCSAKGLWESHPNEDFGYKQRTHFYVSGGGKFRLNKNFLFLASCLATMERNSPISLDLFPGIEYDKTFSIGLLYRTDHYGGLNFKVNVTPCFYLGGAYVHSLNQLANEKITSSFELMIGVRFPLKDEVSEWN
ncbi:MAG: PorP/SprF family type IX secretion system membrane protein [Paludibacteraceae bacterium]|nr:PorP/SprF family type IX secretion system membrane protein [Paludibacteraceae bacterium]